MRPLPIVALFCFAVGIAPSFALPSSIVQRGKKMRDRMKTLVESDYAPDLGLGELNKSGAPKRNGAQPSERTGERPPEHKHKNFKPNLGTTKEEEPVLTVHHTDHVTGKEWD
ncbi:hypothetical protein F5148DRAFT_1203223, partial [Russula earlei]